MKILITLLIVSALSSVATAQQESFDDCVKNMQGKIKIRVSPVVMQGLGPKQFLPDASDIKLIKNANVKVKVMIDETGAVRCAEGVEGEPALYQRSVEAAKHWTFTPYVLNGQPVLVESAFYFHFNKGKVEGKFRIDK